MPQQYTLLTTSFYYSKEHWNTILLKIDAFLNSMAAERSESNYLLEFNYTNGENIRFSLLVAEEMATDQATQIDELISNLPQDTKQRDPHRSIETITQNDLGKLRHKIELSKTILEALKTEEIDDDIVVTFAFYLQIAFDKIIIEKGYATLEQLINIYGGISDDFEKSSVSATSDPEMDDTRNQVLDITKSIFNTGEAADIPYWLGGWMLACEKELEQAEGCTSHSKLLAPHGRIIYQLHKYLALDEKMSLTLSYYIRLALFSKRPEKQYTPSGETCL